MYDNEAEELQHNKIECLSADEVDDIFERTAEGDEILQSLKREILEKYALKELTEKDLNELISQKYTDDVRKELLDVLQVRNTDILNEYVRDN